MTAQGSPTTVLRRALKSRNLRSIELALIDVPHVDLEDAIEIVVLMAEADDDRFESWSNRWVQRVAAAERDGLLTLLERLPDDGAADRLRERARALRGA